MIRGLIGIGLVLSFGFICFSTATMAIQVDNQRLTKFQRRTARVMAVVGAYMLISLGLVLAGAFNS